MRSRKRDDTFKLWLLSCLVFALGGINGGALGVVWIYIQADFGVTVSALGAMVTAATVGRTITSTVSGPIIGRFGIAWVMMGGVTIGAVSMLAFALAPSWLAIMLIALVSGFGSGVMGVGLNAFAAVNFSARSMNWLHGSFGIGTIIGPILVTTVVIDLAIDWRWIYVFFAGTRGLMFVLFYLTRDQWRISEARTKGAKSGQVGIRKTLRLPVMWLLVGAWLMATGNELVAGQYANSFLIDARGIEPKVAAAWVSIYWASLTVSRFVAGIIITRISSTSFMRLNNVVIMIGAGLLSLNLSPQTSLIGLALIGFSIAPFAPLMSSDTPRRVGSAHTANAMGLQFTGASLGMALLPWLGGVLAETVGLEVIPQFVFLIALITFFLYEGIVWRDFKRPLAAAPPVPRPLPPQGGKGG